MTTSVKDATMGVVESDLAEDSEPDYANMSDDERTAAFESLVESGTPADEASVQVWGETGEPVAKPTPPMQIPLPGDWDAISDAFGGSAPTSSEIRLLGGKLPIDGSFAKGSEMDLIIRVKVTGVLGQDTVDAFGQEQGTVRRHMARMISVRRAH